MIFKGSGVAITTPFTDNGINFDTFEKLVEFQIAGGTDAIIVCGTTGEPSTMTKDEKCSAVEFVVRQVGGRVPVIAGAGGNNTADVVECSKHAEKAGADGLLVVNPYYNKCNESGLKGHFLAVANAVGLPIIVYNVPSRTNANISPDVFGKLIEHKNIRAIKEANTDVAHMVEVARHSRGRADMYSGADESVVALMSLGGVGVISVLANIMPRYVHDMVSAYFKGDVETARDMQLKVNPLIKALFCEVSPIPVKTALKLMGYDMGSFRLPLCEMDAANEERLKAEMRAFDLIN